MKAGLARFLGLCLLMFGIGSLVPGISLGFVLGEDQAYTPLRGRWQVVELVDDGRVIPPEAIPTWIPSGGQVEVVDNTFVFTSPADGQRHARTFEVDATRYPREINFRANDKVYGQGIYQLDQGRWVICAALADQVARPTDFAAPKDSRRVLLVLRHSEDPARPVSKPPTADAKQASPAAGTAASNPLPNLPPPPDLRTPAGNTGKLLTDADVRGMLQGTWKYRDAYGDFFLTLSSNGTFNTFRETAKTSAFQQVFVRAPISSGNWVLNNGQLTFRCTASVNRDRVNRQAPYMVRSISEKDLIFMDLRGQVVTAVKVP